MRTTLDIEDDVLQAAKEMASAQKTSTGAILSMLARKALNTPSTGGSELRNGVPVIPTRGEVISLEHVRKLMDAEGI